MTEQLISARTKILIRSAIVLALLSFFAAIWLIPVYSLLINSFKTASGVISTPVLEPAGFSLSAIETVFAQMKQSLLNSLIVTIPVAAVSTFLGAMAAYHLSLAARAQGQKSSYEVSAEYDYEQ